MSERHNIIEQLVVVIRVFDNLCNNVSNVGKTDKCIPIHQVRALTSRMRNLLKQLIQCQQQSDKGQNVNNNNNKSGSKVILDVASNGERHALRNIGNNNNNNNNNINFNNNDVNNSNCRHFKQCDKKKFILSKPSSVGVKKIQRQHLPTDVQIISKDVARCFTCYLYNLLEGVANLTKANSANIFVKKNDEMVSIANVSSRLSFPPSLVHHRCHNLPDAEVLGSGIALNQWVTDSSQTVKSMLLYPIYFSNKSTTDANQAIGVLHLQSKLGGVCAFDLFDESIAYIAACFIGQLMHRLPQFEWLANFYDPITQHIVAPFNPAKYERWSKATFATTQRYTPKAKPGNEVEQSRKEEVMTAKLSSFQPEILICRKTLPALATKSSTYGLTQMPALRQVGTFVDNVHSCWQKSIAKNIELTEADRSEQQQLRVLRRMVAQLQNELTAVKERLRLYELTSSDYKKQYALIQSKLDTYLKSEKRMM